MSSTIRRNYPGETINAGRSKTRISFYMLAFISYWYAPVAYGLWLWCDLKMGAFSADSDSIAIPLMAFVVLWYVGFPFFLLTTIAFEMLMRKRDGPKRSRLMA